MSLIDGKFLGFDLSPKNILLLLVSFVIGYLFFSLCKRQTSLLRTIKYAPGWPVLRQLPAVWRRPKIATLFTEWFDHCGESGIFRYFNYLGPERVILFKGDFIKQMLVTRSTKFKRVDEVRIAVPMLGNGIFTAHGFDHSWQRKLLNPLFSFASVKRYAGSFDRHSLDLVKLWEGKCDSNAGNSAEIRVQDDLNRLAFDVIGDTAFGYEFNSVLNDDDKVCKAFERILTSRFAMSYRLRRFLIPFHDYLPFPSNIAFKKALVVTDNIIDEVIHSKRQKMLSETGDNDTEEVPDLLSIMMRARDDESGKQMTDELLKQNAFTFLLAGHETTSVALTWTLYHLAGNPEVQEKARKEVLSILKNTQSISADVLNDMEYINMVVKESLRVSPPAAFLPRQNLVEEQFGGHIVPVNTFLMVPTVGVQNYYKYWSSPYEFKPERFAETESSGTTGQTYLPFGSGPRNCIGSKFAMMELRIIVARLLSKFKFSIKPDHPTVIGRFMFTFRPIPSPILTVSLIEGQ